MRDTLVAAALVVVVLAVVGLAPDHVCARWWQALGPASKVGPDSYTGLVIVRIGVPGDDHNCDEMGCGTIDHVLSRTVLDGGPTTSVRAEEYIDHAREWAGVTP